MQKVDILCSVNTAYSLIFRCIDGRRMPRGGKSPNGEITHFEYVEFSGARDKLFHQIIRLVFPPCQV